MPEKLYSFVVDFIRLLQPHSILIISPFLDENSARFISDLAAKGVNVVLYTRSPKNVHNSHKKAINYLNKNKLSTLIIVFDEENKIHMKEIYINGKIKIDGSLNFASWSDNKNENINIFVHPDLEQVVDEIFKKISSKPGRVPVIKSNTILGDLVIKLYEIILLMK